MTEQDSTHLYTDVTYEQFHQQSVQGGVYLLYLHSFAFKYRYILYIGGNGCHI
jgi:hypothetical protein